MYCLGCARLTHMKPFSLWHLSRVFLMRLPSLRKNCCSDGFAVVPGPLVWRYSLHSSSAREKPEQKVLHVNTIQIKAVKMIFIISLFSPVLDKPSRNSVAAEAHRKHLCCDLTVHYTILNRLCWVWVSILLAHEKSFYTLFQWKNVVKSGFWY